MSLYGAIKILQSAKILMQNLLFDEKEAIKDAIKSQTTKIVLNHKDAVAMRETLTCKLLRVSTRKKSKYFSGQKEIIYT